MKSTIELLVQDESLYSKFMTTTWFINIFTASKVILQLDGIQHVLKARQEPYTFDVEAGAHLMVFTDPRAKGKRFNRGVGGAIWGGIFGALTGGLGGALGGGAVGASLMNGAKEGGVQVTLDPGTKLCLRCKPTRKGEVQVEQVSYTNR